MPRRPYLNPDNYTKKVLKKFVQDMRRNNLEPYHYKNKFGWEGPAINSDSVESITKLTKVPVCIENFDVFYIIHPIIGEQKVERNVGRKKEITS